MKRSFLIRVILYSTMIAISYWIVRLHTPDPGDWLDKETVLAIHEYVVRQLGEKPLGEEIFRATKALEDKKLFDKPEFTHFLRTLPIPVVEPANQEYARSLTRQVRDNLSELLSLAKEGIAFPSRESVKEWLESGEQESYERNERYNALSVPSFLTFQNSAKALLIESDMYAKEGKWQEAFESFRDIDALAHAIRYDWLIGHLIAVASRGFEAKGFERILFLNPPPGIDRHALSVLNSLCTRHILLDSRAAMVKQLCAILSSAQVRDPFIGEFSSDLATLSILLHNQKFIKNPDNKKWIARITKRYGIDTESMDKYDAMDIFCQSFLADWTTYPSIKKFLGRVGESETELLEPSPLVDAFRDIVSPRVRTRLMVYYALPFKILYEVYVRSTVAAVRLELLRIAFASRVYYHDKKKFPDSVEELVPEYLETHPALEYAKSLLPTTDLETDPNRVLSPVKIKKVELDAQAICSVLGIRQKEEWSEDRVNITPFGDLEWQNLSDEVANVMAEYLARFDRVMEGVAIKPAQNDKKSIIGRINVPQQFVALYSPGPDCDDDGGVIPYDPTNGTVSSGDIIVYPEGFAR